MNYKVKSLFEKVYMSFIRGEYGDPIIPTKNEVIKKIQEITSLEYIPVTDNNKMDDIYISEIQKKFSTVIDDIDILFDSIESESRSVLDQLTNSLKEHEGTKRELRKINSRAKDIAAGRLGEDYLYYSFTENFDDLDKINTFKSDPVDVDAGEFSIMSNDAQVLTFNHYYGRKLEFHVLEKYAEIVNNEYNGSADSSVILDPNDSNSISYRIKLDKPSYLKTAINFQLSPDGRPLEINSVTINLDSSISKGEIRLMTKSSFKWEDVKGLSIQPIKSNRVTFNFPSINTTHLKLEFIKNEPDIPDENEYYFIINHISVYKSTSKRISKLYSKPIVLDKYSTENPVVNTINVSGDVHVPGNSDALLYLAQDIKISGQFVDIDDSPVFSQSSSAVKFDSTQSGFVYLSEIHNLDDTISGIEPYKGLDYDWKQIYLYEDQNKIPKIVDFNNTLNLEKIDNSIYTYTKILWGDDRYTTPYQISGWCNADNHLWSSVLEPLVNSGILVSGEWVASGTVAYEDIEDQYGNLHPLISGDLAYSGQWLGYGSGGYPWAYINPLTSEKIKWGEPYEEINGWWRPGTESVSPTGINSRYLDDDGYTFSQYWQENVPDYYFNNIPFYKIYKFGKTTNILDSSIRLYLYQERPTEGSESYYPYNFIWTYKNTWEYNTGTATKQKLSNQTTFDGYKIDLIDLKINEEYIFDAISDVKIHNTNDPLYPITDWDFVFDSEDKLTGIDFTPLNTSRSSLVPTNISFDYKYRYKVQNKYQSTWTGYAIVSPGSGSRRMIINNDIILDSGNNNDPSTINRVIGKVVIENLDSGQIFEINGNTELITVDFHFDQASMANNHYKITIFCASDINTGFSAVGQQGVPWVPFENSQSKTIIVDSGIKIVPMLVPVTIVDLSTLVYDTPMNNDRRAGLFTDGFNDKYLVTKIPSKDIFPGYYFDSVHKNYLINSDSQIKNIGHYVRKGFLNPTGYLVDYTTGSSGIEPGNIYKTSGVLDNSWNNGSCLSFRPNSEDNVYFPVHSTYKHPINLDREDTVSGVFYGILRDGDVDPRAPYTSNVVGSSDWITWVQTSYPIDYTNYLAESSFPAYGNSIENKGFLFYHTGENLASFYSISYRKIKTNDESTNRFLYKLELISDEKTNESPKVKSLKFEVNKGIQ